MRSLWKYGACGPPTSGPSSHCSPSHRKSSIADTMPSRVTRDLSVSAMRRTNRPLCLRAQYQLNDAISALPTWIEPLGDGSMRVRTLMARSLSARRRNSAPPRIHSVAAHSLDVVAKDADAFDVDLAQVALRK